jgi:hypothetical protein
MDGETLDSPLSGDPISQEKFSISQDSTKKSILICNCPLCKGGITYLLSDTIKGFFAGITGTCVYFLYKYISR